MPKSLKHKRNAACNHQSNCCCYCRVIMAVGGLQQYATKYGLSLGQAKRLQPTAEHLQARCENGSNARSNIAAACWHCNSLRHKRFKPMDAVSYRRYVQKRMAKRRWHGTYVFERVLKSRH